MKKKTSKISFIYDTERPRDKNTLEQIDFLKKVYNATTKKGLISHIVDLLYNKNK